MNNITEKIQIGIIGANFGAQVLLPAFQSNPYCNVTGMVASNPEKNRKIHLQYGLNQSYSHWQELIEDKNIDAIAIAIPPCFQYQIALTTLQHSKPVFAEKPLSTSVEEAQILYDLALQAEVANMVDFSFVGINAFNTAKELLNEFLIGHLRHINVIWNTEIRANVLKNYHGWKVDPRKGGGTLSNLVSHILHYIEWFAGPITGLSAKLFSTIEHLNEVDTFNSITLQLKSGTAVNISVGSDAYLGTGHRIEFYGENGSMLLINETKTYMRGFRLLFATRKENKYSEINVPEDSNIIGDERIAAVSRLAHGFVDWIRNNTPKNPCFYDGLRIQNLLNFIQESNKSGQWIDLLPNR